MRKSVDAGAAAGVVLAAGRSSRMGAFKPLLDVGGRPAAARPVDALREGGASDVVLVTGYGREKLAELIGAVGAVEAYNERFAEGMFSSVKTGLSKALEVTEGRVSAFLLLPADCPLASASAIRALLRAHREYPARFIVPCYRGKKGHPLLIPSALLPEILAHGGEGGLKAVTDRHEDETIRLETGDEGVVLDMDSPEGYEEIRAFCARRAAGDAGDPRGAIKRFTGDVFLVRHGKTQKHAEPIFLGQTDVPLSDEGREQAALAARELIARGVRPAVIHASDLARAAETAEIMAAAMRAQGVANPSVRRDARLREMHLGDWDGRFIREIKEIFPCEYARRGARILTWKRGHGGENFYDLRYRVEKWLAEVLPGARELVAVTHAGAIKAILSALSDMRPETAWSRDIPRGAVGLIRLSSESRTEPFLEGFSDFPPGCPQKRART
ncbi:MAG: histidine phosphatase family protein [Clostridiales Family XIII bacterium]|jgi:broad specificity phosphatase PhoE/CTP:molybdopterin cytidylyltransferase MocA|nr:histidine phosphatase family protein [Clostridiales Family XIII bacterium]